MPPTSRVFEWDASGDARGELLRKRVSGPGNAAADSLAEDKHVGIEFPLGGATAGAGADGVSFVGNKSDP